MKRQTQLIILGALSAVLLVTVYFMFLRSETTGGTAQAGVFNERFVPLNVDNPALRMDILKRFLALEYKGGHRNIFTSSLPQPPAPPAPLPTPMNFSAPVTPAAPPPLTVDAKYFGFVSDPAGSHRKAFFATPSNEEVVIAGEGDTFMGHFRVIRISSTSADVEEVSSGRHATLILEQPGPNG
jgi:hypothetical protein